MIGLGNLLYSKNLWEINRYIYNSIKWSVICIIFGMSTVYAQELSIYDKGLSQYSLSRFDRAAKEWDTLSERLERLGSRNDSQLKRAAFAHVLATIAYEKDNDSRAYNSWSSAIRLYLQTQTKWEDQRQLIANRIAGFSDDVKSYTGENVPSSDLRPDDYILLKMNDLMKLSYYDGPRAGLAVKDKDDDVNNPSQNVESLFGDSTSKQPAYQPSKVGSRRGLRDPSILLNQRAAIRQARRASRQVATSPTAREAERRYNNPSGTNDLFAEEENIFADIPQAAGLKKIEPYSGVEDQRLTSSEDAAFPPEYARIGRVAWRYIENNQNKGTGLVNGLNKQAVASTADIGHALMSYIAAHELGFIDRFKFKNDVETLLNSIEFMDLYAEDIPNRLYNTTNVDILDFEGRPSEKGAGWSSEGVAKLLVALKTLQQHYPDYKGKVTKIVDGWNLALLSGPKGIIDVINISGKEVDLDIVRVGYEQYIAHALSLWGIRSNIEQTYDHAKKVSVNNVSVLADTRDGAQLVLDPFILGEIEMGGKDKVLRESLGRLYSAHVRHWQESKEVAISGRLSTQEQGEYLSYAVFHDKKPWQIVNPDGSILSGGDGAWVSTKNAFAMSILYPGAFGDAVFNQAQLAQSPSGGFYTGLDNHNEIVKNLDLETNATILESLFYMKRDFEPLLKMGKQKTANNRKRTDIDRL